MFRLLRTALVVVLVAIVFQVAFGPRSARRALDPDEPIAADGSKIAGGARTIYDTNPAFGAFGAPPRPDPDDPKDFEQRIKDEKWSMDHSRDAIAALLGPSEWSSCDDAARKKLIAAVQIYYRARGGQKNSFAARGPRAKAAIEQEWSTPLDRHIDEFVRRALQSGFIHKNEMPANVYPEFARTFADTKEIGLTCPPLKADRGIEKL
jgi:hypothetical protein